MGQDWKHDSFCLRPKTLRLCFRQGTDDRHAEIGQILCIRTKPGTDTQSLMPLVRKIVITLKHKICVRAIEMKSQYQMRTVNELFTLRRICACKSYVGTIYMGVRSDYSLCIYRQKAI